MNKHVCHTTGILTALDVMAFFLLLQACDLSKKYVLLKSHQGICGLSRDCLALTDSGVPVGPPANKAKQKWQLWTL